MIRALGITLFVSAAGLSAQSSGKVDGWTMAVRTTADSDGVTSRMPVMNHLYITEHQVRSETVQEKLDNLNPKIDFPVRITDDTAHTVTLIIESNHRAAVSKARLPSSVTVGDSASRFLSGPVMTMRDLGPGETTLGHPTHKYSFALSYVARTTVAKQLCQRTINTVEEIWTAPDLSRDEHLRGYLRDAHPDILSEHGPVADSIENLRVHRERLINGLVLRSVITRKRADAAGIVHTTTSTVEVTGLSHGPIARSLFQVPAGYNTGTMQEKPRYRTPAESVQMAAIRAGAETSMNAKLRATLCDATTVK